jgi:hypothetical protein
MGGRSVWEVGKVEQGWRGRVGTARRAGSRRGPDRPSRGLADRVRCRRIRFNGTRRVRRRRTHDGDLGDPDASSTTGLDVHDVGTAGVAAGDPPGLRVKEAEVGEAAERLGDGVLAEVERGTEVADVRFDGEPL